FRNHQVVLGTFATGEGDFEGVADFRAQHGIHVALVILINHLPADQTRLHGHLADFLPGGSSRSSRSSLRSSGQYGRRGGSSGCNDWPGRCADGKRGGGKCHGSGGEGEGEENFCEHFEYLV